VSSGSPSYSVVHCSGKAAPPNPGERSAANVPPLVAKRADHGPVAYTGPTSFNSPAPEDSVQSIALEMV